MPRDPNILDRGFDPSDPPGAGRPPPDPDTPPPAPDPHAAEPGLAHRAIPPETERDDSRPGRGRSRP